MVTLQDLQQRLAVASERNRTNIARREELLAEAKTKFGCEDLASLDKKIAEIEASLVELRANADKAMQAAESAVQAVERAVGVAT